MMSRKRQNDVSDETVRKRSKFSGAMIKLGAYAAYSVIFLLKKLNRILCDSAKAFTSKTTALILGVIKKFKSIGRKILLPFVSCLKPSRGRFTAKRAETDLTVSSIRITNFKQFINKTVNYAVPAVAIVVFAAVLANASKIDRQISEHNAGSDVDNDVFIAASKDLGFADEIADEVSFEDGKLRFAQPYERFLEDAGTDEYHKTGNRSSRRIPLTNHKASGDLWADRHTLRKACPYHATCCPALCAPRPVPPYRVRAHQ